MVTKIGLILCLIGFSACQGVGDQSKTLENTSPPSLPQSGVITPVHPSPAEPSESPQRKYVTDVLLYNGGGTWTVEVNSLQNILSDHQLSYNLVDANELNAMSFEDIIQYGLMIFPGGNGAQQAGGLTAATHSRLRTAVQVNGVSYFGICAGSFIAQAPVPAAGKDVSYGLGIVPGPLLEYYALENQGIDTAMVNLKLPDGSSKKVLWYGGPMTTNISGGIISKYPDGTPAMSEMWSGKGFVVLSGVHPTATSGMLSSLGQDSTNAVQLDWTWDLINAALTQTPLATF